MKECTQCGILKTFDSFYFKSKKLGKRHSICSVCHNLKIKEHYKNNTAYYLAKAKNRRKFFPDICKKIIKETKEANPCMDCGQRYPYYIMDFDHLGDKLFEVSRITNKKTLLEEIKKCEVVCSNCHRERTHQRHARL